MSESFLLTNDQDYTNLTHNLSRFYPGSVVNTYTIDRITVSIRLHNTAQANQQPISQLITIGNISNLLRLKKILLQFETQALLFEQMKVVQLLFHYFGMSALKLLEGSFVIILVHSENNIQIFTDHMGFIPVYYCRGHSNKFWVTSEIKSLFGIPAIDFSLKNIHMLYQGKFPKHSSSSPYEKIYKLLPQSQLNITSSDKQCDFNISSSRVYDIHDELRIAQDMAESILENLLIDSIEDAAEQHSVIAVPLSGGVDSSLIAALTKNTTSTVHTVCVGREQSNEFSFAKNVSEYLGTTHHEVLFDTQDFNKYLINTLFYNEVHNALCIEIQMPFYPLFQYIKQYSSHIITGYGADMLFGGHLSPTVSLPTVNKLLYDSMLTIHWRGEYNSYVSSASGLSISHPFCVPSILRFGMNLLPELKIKNQHVKYILRELASNHNYLPPEVCYRKKIAIEVASSINTYFSDYLQLTGNAYDKKNVFIHALYKNLFQYQVAPDELDIKGYRDIFINKGLSKNL